MDYPAYSVMTVYYISTTQYSNLVVSIVEHVYRMIDLLLYITCLLYTSDAADE